MYKRVKFISDENQGSVTMSLKDYEKLMTKLGELEAFKDELTEKLIKKMNDRIMLNKEYGTNLDLRNESLYMDELCELIGRKDLFLEKDKENSAFVTTKKG